MKWIVAAVVTLAAGSAAADTIDIAGDASCAIAPADKTFIETGMTSWAYAQSVLIGLKPPERPPHFVLFDKACQYDSEDGKTWTAARHDGKEAHTPLRNGRTDVAPVAFTGPMSDGRSYALVSLPSIWRTNPMAVQKMGDRLDAFLTSVFIHEMTHTRDPGIASLLTAEWAKPFRRQGLSSDTLQARFGDNQEFKAGISHEKQLLFEAAEKRDRAKAREALDAMRARRAKFFVDGDANYAQVEDTFLVSEGAAVFVQYLWLADPKGAGWPEEDAMKKSHDASGVWTLDEGFALMLAVDRLVPDWRQRVFGEHPQTALQLLAAAAGGV